MAEPRPVVTFDLFSALLDSRQGGAAVFGGIGRARGRPVDGQTVYDRGDALNKDVGTVLASMRDWPFWPDVAETGPEWLRAGGVAGHRIGLLSNVDDDIFATTKAAGLVDPQVAMTSQRLGVYKPDPGIYTSARERVGAGMVHVASRRAMCAG